MTVVGKQMMLLWILVAKLGSHSCCRLSNANILVTSSLWHKISAWVWNDGNCITNISETERKLLKGCNRTRVFWSSLAFICEVSKLLTILYQACYHSGNVPDLCSRGTQFVSYLGMNMFLFYDLLQAFQAEVRVLC
jgi:hypothetical protein